MMFRKSANRIYREAENRGVHLECTCVGIKQARWDELMKGATRADTKKVDRILLKHKMLTKEEVKWKTRYHYYKTETHLIRVWSGIEHFYKINTDADMQRLEELEELEDY